MTGAELIVSERERQIEEEFFTASHDDEHTKFELLRAAEGYMDVADWSLHFPHLVWPYPTTKAWPWTADRFKPSSDPVRNLVKAGALIAAEIDRLQRKSK